MKKYIIVIIIIVIVSLLLSRHTENFITYPYAEVSYGQRYCKDCKQKTILNCGNCYNCGICVKGNISKCASGDMDGPIDEDCDTWIHGGTLTSSMGFPQYPQYPQYLQYGQYYPYYYPFYTGLNHRLSRTYRKRNHI